MFYAPLGDNEVRREAPNTTRYEPEIKDLKKVFESTQFCSPTQAGTPSTIFYVELHKNSKKYNSQN